MPYLNVVGRPNIPCELLNYAEFLGLIGKGIVMPYSVVVKRREFAQNVDAFLNSARPLWTEQHRFPAVGIYLDPMHVKVKGELMKLAHSLDLNTRWMKDATDVEDMREYSKTEDNRTMFYNTLQRLASLADRSNIDSSHVNGLYTRNSLEATYDMRWD